MSCLSVSHRHGSFILQTASHWRSTAVTLLPSRREHAKEHNPKPWRKSKSQLVERPRRRSNTSGLRISSAWLGCDPEEIGNGEPDVEALRFRGRTEAEVSLSEQVSDRGSDVCGVYNTVFACWGIRATCEPPVRRQELYLDVRLVSSCSFYLFIYSCKRCTTDNS